MCRSCEDSPPCEYFADFGRGGPISWKRIAAESENVVQSAQEKLKKKNLDLIVANDISAPGIGFQSDSNQVTLIDKEGTIDSLPRLSKREIADILLDRVKEKMGV